MEFRLTEPAAAIIAHARGAHILAACSHMTARLAILVADYAQPGPGFRGELVATLDSQHSSMHALVALPGGRVAFDADGSIGIWTPATGALRYFTAGHAVRGLVAHVDGRLISYNAVNVLSVWDFAADGESATQVMLGFEDPPFVASVRGTVHATAAQHAYFDQAEFEFDTDTRILQICPINQNAIAILTEPCMIVLAMDDFRVRQTWRNTFIITATDPQFDLHIIHCVSRIVILLVIHDSGIVAYDSDRVTTQAIAGSVDALVPLEAPGEFLVYASGAEYIYSIATAKNTIMRISDCQMFVCGYWTLNDGRIVMSSCPSAVHALRAAQPPPRNPTAAAVGTDSVVSIGAMFSKLIVWNAELNRVVSEAASSDYVYIRVVSLDGETIVAQTSDGQLTHYG